MILLRANILNFKKGSEIKFHLSFLFIEYFFIPLHSQKGTLAEWLGSGLQHHLQRFESARYLQKTTIHELWFFLFSESFS